MIDHLGIHVTDRHAAERCYRAVLGEPTARDDDVTEWDDFGLDGRAPATRGLHVGFAAASRADVDAFHRAGLEAGFTDDGAPGERDYLEGYYGAFLRDGDGNSIEAVHHARVRTNGRVDHVWLRVRDLEVSAAFYDTIAPHAGLRRTDEDGLVLLRSDGGLLVLVAGGPRTEHVHLAFTGDRAASLVDPDGHGVEVVRAARGARLG